MCNYINNNNVLKKYILQKYQAIIIHPFEQMLGVKDKNKDQNICSLWFTTSTSHTI